MHFACFLIANTAAQVILADQECGLQETVVKLVQPGGVSWYYPSAVKLFRCMGSSGFLSPHVQHCAVTRQQQLAVQVFEFFPSGSYLFTTTNVMNHTACDKDCVVQASDCKPNVESYNNQTCSCDCVTVTACNTTFQVTCDTVHFHSSWETQGVRGRWRRVNRQNYKVKNDGGG